MMAAITMGSDGDSLRLGREAWTRFISTWAVFESGSICLMVREIRRGAHGNGRTKVRTTRRTNQRQKV